VIFTISTATGVLALLPQVTMFSANFGLLVIIFENLLYDLWRWLAILVFFVSAFSILFVGLFAAGWVSAPDDDITHVMGPAAAPFWALFGSWNYDNFGNRPLYTPAVLVLFVYALFANLALVNLLIAMFSDTYARLSKEAMAQYAHQRCRDLLLQHHVLLLLPPPFNAPLALWEVIGHPLTSFRFDTNDADGVTAKSEIIRNDGSLLRDAFLIANKQVIDEPSSRLAPTVPWSM